VQELQIEKTERVEIENDKTEKMEDFFPNKRLVVLQNLKIFQLKVLQTIFRLKQP